nr:diguanylate cyclase [Acidimicrobiales bacterium]
DQVLTSDADAFAVLLEGLHELMDATVVAERILNRLEGPVAVSGVSIEIDTRVGVAYSPNSVGNPDGLIEAAGREVHVARRNGDDRLVIHEPVDPLQTAVG